MPTLRLMRRLADGMHCMLLAALLLLARVIAPALPMPPDPGELLALQTICHTGAPDQPAEPTHTDCLLCPACHLAAQAVLPTPATPAIPIPLALFVALSALAPPATGPPSRIQTQAQPTGPPTVSA